METLKKLKNKIVGVTFKSGSEEFFTNNIFLLIDYDAQWMEMKNYMGEIVYLNVNHVYTIEESIGEDKKKFEDYSKKYKINKNFKGDFENSNKQESNYLG